jgi:coiled-coil domain-containing protein 39
MVDENLKKLEVKKFKELLESKADQVLELNKRRIELEAAMKERRIEIGIHQEMLKTQLRSSNDELQVVSSEFKERIAKVDKLKKR